MFMRWQCMTEPVQTMTVPQEHPAESSYQMLWKSLFVIKGFSPASASFTGLQQEQITQRMNDKSN